MSKIIILIAIFCSAFEGYLYYLKTQGENNTLNPVRFIMYKKYEQEIRSFLKTDNSEFRHDAENANFSIIVTSYSKRDDGSLYVRALTGTHNPNLSEEENQGCCGLSEFIKKNNVWSEE